MYVWLWKCRRLNCFLVFFRASIDHNTIKESDTRPGPRAEDQKHVDYRLQGEIWHQWRHVRSTRTSETTVVSGHGEYSRARSGLSSKTHYSMLRKCPESYDWCRCVSHRVAVATSDAASDVLRRWTNAWTNMSGFSIKSTLSKFCSDFPHCPGLYGL